MTEVGKVTVVATRNVGTFLVGDHASGVTVLNVLDRVEFAEGGGQLLVGTETLAFDPWDGDTDLQPLTVTTATAAAHEDGTGVLVVPAATKTIATVVFDGEGEGIPVEVPTSMIAQLSEGIRDDGEQETVELEPGDSGWTIVKIIKESALYDASAAPIVTATDGGERTQIDGDGINLYTDDPVQMLVFTTVGTAYRLAVDSAGNIYTAGFADATLRKFNSLGALTLSFTTTGSADGVAVNAAGNIFVADTTNKLIRKFTSAGVQVVTGGFPISTTGVPRDVALDAAGNIYTADRTNKLIRKFTSAGVQVVTGGFPISTTGLPECVEVDAAGNIFVGDSTNSLVRKFNSTGTQTLSFTAGEPLGIALDTDGNIFIADISNVVKFDSIGTFATAVWFAQGIDAHDVALDVDGNVYATDPNSNVVRKYNNPGTLLASALLTSALGRLKALEAIIAGNLEVDSISSANGLQITSPIAALQKMQAGTVSLAMGGAATATVSVTFPVAFLTAPIVVACGGAGNTSPILIDEVSAITTTGFTLTVMVAGGTTSTATRAHNWIAIVP